MTEKVKVGVFGVGSLGQWHARIYSELDDADFVGVYDVDEDRAKEIAHKYGAKPFSDIDELASLIDAASVAVPTHLHFDIFNQLLKHRLHLMMEKPIASTTEEAETMSNAARDNDLILQVGHVERFNPVMEYLEKQLNQPRFIEAIRLAPYPPQREGAAPRGTEVSVVLDLMIHDLEIILHLVKSPIKDVSATGVAVLSPSEDIANVRLAFENGCVANITASRISQEQLRKIRVFQEDSYLSLDYRDQIGQLAKKTATGIEVSEVPINKDEPLLLELQSFIECVHQQNEPKVTGEHGSQALKLAVKICETIRDNPS